MYQLLNSFIKEYIIGLGVFAGSWIVLTIFRQIILVRIKKLTKQTSTDVDDLLIKIIKSVCWPFYFLLSLHIAFQFIVLPSAVEKGALYALYIIIAFYLIKTTENIIDYGADKITQKRQGSIVNLLAKILKVIVWITAIIIILQNLGYNITALVAGLGIGGLAVAFALQNILADVFASFVIYFDKPFEVGDFIIIGKKMGTVKKIGIKSTRIQALQGEEIVISNKALTEAEVQNFKKMEKRRITFTIGITYETSAEKARKIPEIIKGIIEKVDLAEVNRVHFKDFGDFSLNFEIVYYLNSSDYNQYMDIQEKINLAIKEEFEKEKIDMAYPTQVVYMGK